MRPAETPTRLRAEDLPRLANDRDLRRELDEGRLIEMSPVNLTHGTVVARLTWSLQGWVQEHGGRVAPEVGWVLQRNPDTLRGPDLSFIRAERLPDLPLTGFVPGAPDLAIEVLSPDDRAAEITRKVRQYLQAGARAVWLVDPEARQVQVLAAGGADQRLENEDTLTAPGLLPGWALPLAQLFA